MSFLTRTTALTAAGALLAVPAAVLVSSPAQAAESDIDRSGACGGGRYEFSVDREDGGHEISVDLDRVEPGSRWTVVLRHDGKRFAKQTLTADNEGDLDLDRYRNNGAGKDTYKFRAARVDGSAGCGRAITVS